MAKSLSPFSSSYSTAAKITIAAATAAFITASVFSFRIISSQPVEQVEMFAVIPRLTASFCPEVGASCTTGKLVEGVGYTEKNSPSNTIDSCLDGTFSGKDLDSDEEYIHNVTVSSFDGGQVLQGGQLAKIDAYINAPCGVDDTVDFYYTSDPAVFPPDWTFIETVIAPALPPDVTGPCIKTDLIRISVNFTLPTDSAMQAIRVNLYNTYATHQTMPCTQGDYSDVDDLIFSVATA